MLSISFALIPEIAELTKVEASPEANCSNDKFTTSSCTAPSTTHNGLVSPKIDDPPRIVILGDVPKVPEMFCTFTPAARPSIIRPTSTTPSILILSALRVWALPVNLERSNSW